MKARLPWFRLYSEARNDAKLRTLADDEHRVWFGLLCLAAECDDRGTIPMDGFVLAVEVANGDEELLDRAVDKLTRLRVLDRGEDGRLFFLRFRDRQYDKPSDQPERVAERVRKHRIAKATPQERPSDTRNADVTPRNALEKSREEKRRGGGGSAPTPPPAEPEPPKAHPYALLEAVCDELGQDAAALSKPAKDRQLAAAKRIAAAGMGEADVRSMVRWLAPQSWVNGAVDMGLLEKQLPKWEMAGRPNGPPRSAALAAGPSGRTIRNGKDIGYSNAELDAMLQRGRR